MKRFHGIEDYSDYVSGCGTVLTAAALGKFDGVHIGHVKLIRQMTDYARNHSLSSLVFAIETGEKTILSHEERARFLQTLGVDYLVECPFSEQFMRMGAEEFVRDVLVNTLHAVYVCVGTDFAFGHGRKGNVLLLQKLGELYGFHPQIVKKEQLSGTDVSSTRVRNALEAGNMELVTALLGRPYPVSGTVMHGHHLGTQIGNPTINVHPDLQKLLPPDGVYASITHLPDDTRQKGITNVGIRPTVDGKTRKAETTLFDYHCDLYGETVTCDLISYIRPERRFSGLEELIEQIGRDKERAREILQSGSIESRRTKPRSATSQG